MKKLFRLTVRAAANCLRRGEVSPIELVEAAADRIAETDGDVNALPTLCIERARADRRIAERLPIDAKPASEGGQKYT